MTDGVYFAAGFAVGFSGITLLIYLLICRPMLKKRNSKFLYDERQELMRGKGYKCAFFTLMFYDLVYVMLDIAMEKKFIDAGAATFLGVCIAITVYVSYCIWNESYFGLAANRVQIYYLIIFACIGVLNLYMGIRNIITGVWIEDGRLTFENANLFCGIMMFVIVIQMLAKRMRDGKEEE